MAFRIANGVGGGTDIREQDRVLGVDGLSKAIPSTYDRHPFKILEIYEDTLQRQDH